MSMVFQLIACPLCQETEVAMWADFPAASLGAKDKGRSSRTTLLPLYRYSWSNGSEDKAALLNTESYRTFQDAFQQSTI
jgi:hypothetical protein